MRDSELRLTGEVHIKYALPVKTTDYVDVVQRARELGCRVPVGIALLPGNFATATGRAELRYHVATPYIRSAWRNIGLVDSGPFQQPSAGVAASGTADPDVPLAVFFGAELESAPPMQITLALGGAATVLMYNPVCASPREIRFSAIVERPSGGYACLTYCGATSELVTLARSVRGVWASFASTQLESDIAQSVV